MDGLTRRRPLVATYTMVPLGIRQEKRECDANAASGKLGALPALVFGVLMVGFVATGVAAALSPPTPLDVSTPSVTSADYESRVCLRAGRHVRRFGSIPIAHRLDGQRHACRDDNAAAFARTAYSIAHVNHAPCRHPHHA